VLEAAGLFLLTQWFIERYVSEIQGGAAGVWKVGRTHPPTLIRWHRMLDKVRGRVPPSFFAKLVTPQIRALNLCLGTSYMNGVKREGEPSLAAHECRFQTEAFEMLGVMHLVPPHVFIACRCAQAAVSRGAMPSDQDIMQVAIAADNELESIGARSLRSYDSVLRDASLHLCQEALRHADVIGAEIVSKFAGRLADLCVLDQRTRFQKPSH
jgi:hypothetical protein